MKPIVLSELDTLMLLKDRRASLARFGDGEIKLAALRKNAPGQKWAPDLARALCRVAATNFKRLIVAIPRIFEGIPNAKRRHWRAYLRPGHCTLWTEGREYGSAFVSRPDFYGKPFGQEYWDAMRQLWNGRDVLLVRGNDKIPALFDNAISVEPMRAPNRDAWASYHDVLAECLTWAAEHKGGLVIAQLGPTATVLAHDLAIRGVQCLDLGKADRFYRDEQGAAHG